MKLCGKCKENKSLSCFGKNKRRANGLQTWCKSCMNANSREYYALNSEKMKSQISRNKRQRIDTNRGIVGDYMKSSGCVTCGISDVRVLDFHHLDPDRKDGNVMKILHSGMSIETVMEEMGKCIVVCKNCHAIKHSSGTWRSKFESNIPP